MVKSLAELKPLTNIQHVSDILVVCVNRKKDSIISGAPVKALCFKKTAGFEAQI